MSDARLRRLERLLKMGDRSARTPYLLELLRADRLDVDRVVVLAWLGDRDALEVARANGLEVPRFTRTFLARGPVAGFLAPLDLEVVADLLLMFCASCLSSCEEATGTFPEPWQAGQRNVAIALNLVRNPGSRGLANILRRSLQVGPGFERRSVAWTLHWFGSEDPTMGGRQSDDLAARALSDTMQVLWYHLGAPRGSSRSDSLAAARRIGKNVLGRLLDRWELPE